MRASACSVRMAVILLLLSVDACCAGSVLFASPLGNTSVAASCTSTEPCSLAVAVASSMSGDTVVLSRGLFIVDATNGITSGITLSIVGAGPETQIRCDAPTTGAAFDVKGTGTVVMFSSLACSDSTNCSCIRVANGPVVKVGVSHAWPLSQLTFQVSDCIFSNNSNSGNDSLSVIRVDAPQSLVHLAVERTSFRGNRLLLADGSMAVVPGSGAAIGMFAANSGTISLSVSYCDFVGNSVGLAVAMFSVYFVKLTVDARHELRRVARRGHLFRLGKHRLSDQHFRLVLFAKPGRARTGVWRCVRECARGRSVGAVLSISRPVLASGAHKICAKLLLE
jgi:hypothetical protein